MIRNCKPFLFLLAMCCYACQAEKTWTKPTAEELAMTAQPGAPGAAAVYLYREESYGDNDGRHFKSIYVRLKVLTEAGCARGDVEVQAELPPRVNSEIYDLFVTDVEGRTIHPDGSVIPFSGKTTTRIVRHRLGRWAKAAFFSMPSVTAGSIVEYRYIVQEQDQAYDPVSGLIINYLPPKIWRVQNDLYLRKGHFVWKTAAYEPTTFGRGDKLAGRVAWAPLLPAGAEIVEAQKPVGSVSGVGIPARYELDVHDVPAASDKPDAMPAATNYHVNLYYTSFNTLEERWKDSMEWWKVYAELLIAHGSTTVKIVQGIVQPGDTEDQKLRKIYAAVMALENTDYPLDSEEPPKKLNDGFVLKNVVKTTDDIWQRKRGNSQQLAALFVSLARAAGLKAYAVAIGSREREMFFMAYPSTFQLQQTLAIVVVDGSEQFFDPGSRYCDYGHLDWKHQGMKGFRETADKPIFVETPVESYKESTTARQADIKLDERGVAQGTVQITLTGNAALAWRQSGLRNDTQGLAAALEKSFGTSLPVPLETKLASIAKLSDYDQPLTLTFTVQGPVGQLTGTRLELPGDLLQGQNRTEFDAAQRTSTVMFPYNSRTIDRVRIHLSPALHVVSVPQNATHQIERSAVYQRSATSAPGVFSVDREFVMNQLFVLPQDYPPLHTFYSAMQQSDRELLVLQSVAGAP